jgi:CHAT domain-containing protein
MFFLTYFQKYRSRQTRIPIGIYLAVIGIMALVSGCATSTNDQMSSEDARKIALQFEGAYKSKPPRGMGKFLELMCDMYKDPPDFPPNYHRPKEKYTEKDLDNLSRQYAGTYGDSDWWLLQRKAEFEFLNGNFGLAIRMIDRARSVSKHEYGKVCTYATKAVFLSEAGDFKAAEKIITKANGLFHNWSFGSGSSNAVWRSQIGYFVSRGRAAVYFASGDIKRAEKEHYKTLYYLNEYNRLRPLQKQFAGWRRAWAKLNLARILMWQGRLMEAEICARQAFRKRPDKVIQHCLITLSEIFYEQGRYKEAWFTARAALHYILNQSTIRFPLDSYIRARSRETLAKALIALGRWDGALLQFETIREELKTDLDTFNKRFRPSKYWGLSMLMSGNPQAALSQLEISLKRAIKQLGDKHYAVAEIRSLKAMAMAACGQQAEALEIMDQAVPLLVTNWRDKDGSSVTHRASSKTFQLIAEAYIAMLADSQLSPKAAKAFIIAGALQNQSVGKALAASSTRSTLGDPELATTIRQRQDLEMKLAALENRFAAFLQAPDEYQNDVVKEELNQGLQQLKNAVRALDREVKERFPNYAAIVNPESISINDVRRLLTEDEALIFTFVGQNHSFIWALPKKAPMAFASIPHGENFFNQAIAHLHRSLIPGNIQFLSDVPIFDTNAAYDLYKKLLKPVEPGWKQAQNLIYIPHGPLGQLPLSILPTAPVKIKKDKKRQFSDYRLVPWLARSQAVTVLPSTAAFVALRSLPVKHNQNRSFIGFGDPFFNVQQLEAAQKNKTRRESLLASSNAELHVRGIRVTANGLIDEDKSSSIQLGDLMRLPDTADEIIAIAGSVGADTDKDVFLGVRASEHQVKTVDLSDRRIIAFATHGLVPGDLDGLDEPALALSTPDVTGDMDSDGLLTMGEIMGLRLNADWVVLSACNSGAAEGAGAEAVSGLGQAFFYAGARSLLVTSWPVESTAARIFVADLFQRQSADPLSHAEAVQQTRIAMIEGIGGKANFYAHPIFWAPFLIVGEGSQ